MKCKLFLFVAVHILASLIFSLNSLAAPNNSVLFDSDCIITDWHFHLSYHKISDDNVGEGIIQVTKNISYGAVKGGFLFLNDQFIFLQSFLDGSAATLEKSVNLNKINYLVVFLRGTPGARLSIKLSLSPPQSPPIIASFIADPPAVKRGQMTTLFWSTESADAPSHQI